MHDAKGYILLIEKKKKKIALSHSNNSVNHSFVFVLVFSGGGRE